MNGWIVAAYLAGALVLVLWNEPPRYPWREWVALACWPVLVIVGPIWKAIHRRRTTCRICGGQRVDRAALLRHMELKHSEVSP